MQNGIGAVVAVGLAVLCCALPLLFLSGVSIGAGLIFGEIALVAVGVGALAMPSTRSPGAGADCRQAVVA